MKASYKTLSGESDTITYEAILAQPMSHKDGFTLLGFDSWEDVHDEKPCSAVTNVVSFFIDREKSSVGFHNED